MRKVTIAPYVFHKGLINSYQEEDPFYDVKIITKEEILSEFYGKLDDKAIAYLLSKNELNIDQIQQIKAYIPFATKDSSSEKIHKLYLYNKDLKEHGFLKSNEYLKYLFENKEIEIIGYPKKDRELSYVLDYFSLKYEYKEFSNDLSNKYLMKCYKNLELEALDLLNEIAKQIDDGVDINNIYILVNNDDLLSYLKQFHESFNIPINFNDKIPLSYTEIGKKIISNLEQFETIKSVYEYIEESFDSTDIEEFIKIIKEIDYDFLDFEKKIELIKYNLSNYKTTLNKYDNAVNVVSDFPFLSGKTVYIPCFVQGTYPFVSKDNEYISDADKVEINANPSYVLTSISDWNIGQFLMQNNDVHISYSKEHLSSSFMISPFAILNDFSIVAATIPEVFYSDEYRKILQTIYLDLFYVFRETSSEYYSLKDLPINYKNYDNSYSVVNVYNNSSKLTHSYSSLSEYYECPFKYYIEHILFLNKKEDFFAASIGTISHDVFENFYKDEDFDFDQQFEKSKAKANLNELDSLLMDGLKNRIKKAIEIMKLHKEEYMAAVQVEVEKPIICKLDENTSVNGRIDKACVLDNEYVVLIDYKSGNDKIDLKNLQYGEGLQLPLYAFLIEHYPPYAQYKIGGLYLQKFINSKYSYSVKEDDYFDPIYKLEGLTNIDQNFINKFDYTFRDGPQSKFIQSVEKKKNGEMKLKSKLLSTGDFEELAQKAKELVLSANDRIRANDFKIAPLKIKNSTDACAYCKNKDICFVKKQQFNEIKMEEENEVVN